MSFITLDFSPFLFLAPRPVIIRASSGLSGYNRMKHTSVFAITDLSFFVPGSRFFCSIPSRLPSEGRVSGSEYALLRIYAVVLVLPRLRLAGLRQLHPRCSILI